MQILATSVVLFLLGVISRRFCEGGPRRPGSERGQVERHERADAPVLGDRRVRRSSLSGRATSARASVTNVPQPLRVKGKSRCLTLVVDSLLHRGLEVTALGRTHSCSRCARSIST